MPRLLRLILPVLIGAGAFSTAIEASVPSASDRCYEERELLDKLVSTKELYEDAGEAPQSLLRIVDLCPAEAKRLLNHEWAEFLPGDASELTVFDLEAFYEIYDDYQSRQAGAFLDPELLPVALERLNREPQEAPSFWEQLMHWLQNWFGEEEQIEFDWLEEIKLSDVVIKGMFYSSVVLILIITFVLIVREVRAVMYPKRQPLITRWESGDTKAQAEPPNFEALRNAPIGEQPKILLQIILKRLEVAGLLRVRASLTHREINTATTALPQASAIALISKASEKSLYAGWVPSAAEMDDLVGTGEKVYRAIEVPGK